MSLKFYYKMASFQTVINLLIIVILSEEGSAQIQEHTPPPKGPRPIVSGGVVYNLWHIPSICHNPQVLRPDDFRLGGIIIRDKKAILKNDTAPHRIKGNIEIAPEGCLYIQPGTSFHFGPGFGIIVNGTLIARGSEDDGGRIMMTKDPENVKLVGPSSDWPDDARLVDGNTTRDGRLELLYNGKWKGICTNHINYTEIDANVTCRQLGFVWGNFTYHSFSRNMSEYMLFKEPSCAGHENSLFNCVGGSNIKTGTHICDDQQVIGFQCDGLREDLGKDHWRGIEFYNSTVEEVIDGSNVHNETLSWLEYLDISYAGRDIYQSDDMHYGRGSISASPNVPLMNNISVTHGAYDGLNLTEINGRIHIANSTISHNRGHGIALWTTVGLTLINMTDITDNWGDGIKMYLVNKTIHNFNRDFPASESFCRTPAIGSPSYPRLEHENIIDFYGGKPFGYKCGKDFSTTRGKRITVHFLLMERDPLASGTMTIKDGRSSGTVIGTFDMNNGSFPQSITSSSNLLWVEFTYTLPPAPSNANEDRCKTFYPCIRFLLEFTSGDGPDEELRFINSSASNNTGYGVSVQEMRSMVFINASVISDNNYGAGLRIYQGAGEVIVNNTVFSRNALCGANLTYAGGFQLFNGTTFTNNKGYGLLTEYLLLNKSRFEWYQKMEVVRGDFQGNQWISLRVGNYCRGGEILVNESYFGFNLDEAIEYLSCNVSTVKDTNFSVAFNLFEFNHRHAILMAPLLNTIGRMTNNTIRYHSLGGIRIDNGYDLLINRWYSKFSVEYEIFSNRIESNNGRYGASMRLTQNSPFQKIDFKFNEVIDNNINESSLFINPRSRANAPVVVSSSNINVQRNWINNPNSVRDLATHLTDPSVTINVNYNWWGTTSHEYIYSRIFDQDDRYNLAELEYYPVLKEEWLFGHYTTIDIPKHRPVFGKNDRIGGILDTPGFTTDFRIKHYIVDKDIFILPGVSLIIQSGTTLSFETSIGMVVHGTLVADGNGGQGAIKFTLYPPDLEPLVNMSLPVRLVDGTDAFEGRLEVEVDDQWGTVCNVGWLEQNSAVLCQQLGMTFNPEYGDAQQKMEGSSGQPIWLSEVTCDDLDTDLLACRSQKAGNFYCSHLQDVFVRCQPSSWAGINIAAVPRGGEERETQIRNVVVENAGLLDYELMAYTPALKIDYNFYSISALTVKNSVSHGIQIQYSHPYSDNRLEHSHIDNNLGSGLITRSPFLQVFYTTMNNNGHSGFTYDPYFSEYEALSVRSSIYKSRKIYLTDTPHYDLGDSSMIFLLCNPGDGVESTSYHTELQVSNRYRVTLQIFDYNPLTNIEKVTIFDSDKSGIGSNTNQWEIEEDLIDFPIVSTSSIITIRLQVSGVRSGRLTFAAISHAYSPDPPNARVNLHNVTFQNNDQGIVTKHYNNPSNENQEIFQRTKLETIHIKYGRVLNNRKEAMHIPSLTKYHENFIPTLEEMTQPQRVAVIKYNIEFCEFYDNGRGIFAEHNHVDFANNVWHWTLTNCRMERSASGGLEIELPRVSDEINHQSHSVTIHETKFINNLLFACTIAGYYANITLTNNALKNNLCRRGLLTISGMEKDMQIYNNIFSDNQAKFALDMDITSHSEYGYNVTAVLAHNNIQNNHYAGTVCTQISTIMPSTFAVALKGVQKVVAHRNLIENPNLQYELVAGIQALLLESTVDVRENWWGTSDQYQIKQRIFDFDDWNSYAIAEYFPQLTLPRHDSDVSTGSAINIPLDLYNLGGRIWNTLSLPKRSTPYIVRSDLTVMPGAVLYIEHGTELHFQPNVGILVLGQLVARGLPYSRIKMKPLTGVMDSSKSGTPCSVSRTTRAAYKSIRLRGGLQDNEGFLELFNSTTNTWNIMCDSQFNEKTAEVVCRELGMETVNVKVRFTDLYDYFIYGKPMYFLKEFWAYSYYCHGDEESMDMCMKRVNYNILPCIDASNYTFIRCAERNLPSNMEYWGNIRFASATYEESIDEYVRTEDRSMLENVDIYGAGMLHGEKVGAIQATYITPIMNNLNVTGCVSNGLDFVAPRQELNIEKQNISGNLGFGINVIVLNGDSQDNEYSAFEPLVINTVPYYLYGLVDICHMEKDIPLTRRMILFYKYSEVSVDCVKIIRSSHPGRTVALRFLQFNLYSDDFYRNSVEIFDGKIVSQSSMIAELSANSSRSRDVRRRYLSTGDTMTVHIHASESYDSYGFIAEVVTIPLSGLTYPDSKYHHTFSELLLHGNEEGAVMYKNVGEINPSLFIKKCWIENNGYAVLNLTSFPVIDIKLQDTLLFNFDNNFVSHNKGGIYINARTRSIATALKANITNNVFAYGTNGEALNISGHHFQRFYMFENYIFNYTTGDFRDAIHIKNVVVNFTSNLVTDNTCHFVISAYNAENTDATQLYTRNLIYDNNSTALYRATFRVGSGKPVINNNYLVNPESEFEMEANLKAMYNGHPVLQEEPVDARENWWGSERRGFINGRIWDGHDNSSLVSIVFEPFKIGNQSLIEGKCAPGWSLYNERCYRYIGAALPYFEAENFCKMNQGFLAELVDDRESFLRYLLRLSQNIYNPSEAVWVYSDVRAGYCSSMQNAQKAIESDCYYTLRPSICERDPYIAPPGDSILLLAIGISAGVFGIALIVIIILVILWRVKSGQRKKQRFERQSSIRSSYRSRSTLSMLSDYPSKRRLHELDASRSTLSVLTDTVSKRNLEYLSNESLSQGSSRRKVSDLDETTVKGSVLSLSGVTVDETETENARDPQRGRQQHGRHGRFDYGQDSGNKGNIHRSMDSLGNHTPHKSRYYDGPPKDMSRSLNTLGNTPNGHIAPKYYVPTTPTTIMGQNIVRHSPEQANIQDNAAFTDDDDGYSDNEFDDETNDEGSFSDRLLIPKLPPGVENEIDSIRMNSTSDIPINYTGRYDDTPSVDMSHRTKSLSSFSQPESPPADSCPPTPPPPLPLDAYFPRRIDNSPSSSQNSLPSKPVPRNRPIPKQRSVNSSKSSVNRSKDNLRDITGSRTNMSGSKANLHGSRNAVDGPSYMTNSRETIPMGIITHQSRENIDSIDRAADNQGNLEHYDTIPADRVPSYLPNVGHGGENPPDYFHQSRDNLVQPTHNMYREQIPEQNYKQRSREDLTMNYGNIPMSNDDYMPRNRDEQSMGYGVPSYDKQNYMHGSGQNTKQPGYGGSREDSVAPVDYMQRSRENLAHQGYGGSRENIVAPVDYMQRSRENLAHQSYGGSRDNITEPANYIQRSRDNIPEIDFQQSNENPRPKPIETEI